MALAPSLARPSGAPLARLEQLPDSIAGLAPADAAERFRDLPGLAVLESARPARGSRWSYLAADPLVVVSVEAGALLGATAASPPDGEPSRMGMRVLASARALLARMDAGRSAGSAAEQPPFLGGLIGLLGYDFGRGLERLPGLARLDQDLPVVRLALHDWVVAWDRRTGRAWLGGRAVDGDEARLAARMDEVRERLERARVHASHSHAVARPRPLAFRSGFDRPAWVDRVRAVQSAIAAGELYQANLARRLEAPFEAEPWPLYRALVANDPAGFSAYVDLGPSAANRRPRAIVSASPEPFLAIGEAGGVVTDPIKGTRPRGSTRADDRALAFDLLTSAKDRAENIMIVDVLRNDLGRVCRAGSVRVPRLCRLERTPTVQHLVSTVTGKLAPGADAFDLLGAAFPGGSVTGAPKIRAMQLIDALEPVRRGPYTGALGWIGPDGRMATSILIRTLVADGSRLSLHVGGGITWRSDPDAEWEETNVKARGPLRAIGAHEVA